MLNIAKAAEVCWTETLKLSSLLRDVFLPRLSCPRIQG